jgi:hypothetical protein
MEIMAMSDIAPGRKGLSDVVVSGIVDRDIPVFVSAVGEIP